MHNIQLDKPQSYQPLMMRQHSSNEEPNPTISHTHSSLAPFCGTSFTSGCTTAMQEFLGSVWNSITDAASNCVSCFTYSEQKYGLLPASSSRRSSIENLAPYVLNDDSSTDDSSVDESSVDGDSLDQPQTWLAEIKQIDSLPDDEFIRRFDTMLSRFAPPGTDGLATLPAIAPSELPNVSMNDEDRVNGLKALIKQIWNLPDEEKVKRFDIIHSTLPKFESGEQRASLLGSLGKMLSGLPYDAQTKAFETIVLETFYLPSVEQTVSALIKTATEIDHLAETNSPHVNAIFNSLLAAADAIPPTYRAPLLARLAKHLIDLNVPNPEPASFTEIVTRNEHGAHAIYYGDVTNRFEGSIALLQRCEGLPADGQELLLTNLLKTLNRDVFNDNLRWAGELFLCVLNYSIRLPISNQLRIVKELGEQACVVEPADYCFMALWDTCRLLYASIARDLTGDDLTNAQSTLLETRRLLQNTFRDFNSTEQNNVLLFLELRGITSEQFLQS